MIPGDQFASVVEDKPLCPTDFNHDGVTNGADLAGLLGAWGGTDPTYDVSGDGVVGGADLSIVLAAWGACP